MAVPSSMHTPLEHALAFDMDAVNAVINQIRPFPNERHGLHVIISKSVAECIGGLRARALVPIRTIKVDAGEYQHPPDDLTRPEIPNGYPVLVITFNGSKICMIGLKRKLDKYDVVIAELTASRLMLDTVQ